MADWGKTAQGGTTAAAGGVNQRIGRIATAFPEDGTINSISAWVGEVNSTTQRVKFGLYDSSGNLLGETDIYSGATIGATPAVVTLNLTTPYAATGGSDYRLGLLFESGSSLYNHDFVGNFASNDTSTWPNFADPNLDPFDVGHELSIYATYTAGGASGTNLLIDVDTPANPALKWGETHTVTVNQDGTTSTQDVTLEPPTGWDFVNFGPVPALSANPAEPASIYEAVLGDATLGNYAMVAGADLLAFQTHPRLTMNADTTFVMGSTEPAENVSLQMKIWKDATSEWTPEFTVNINDLGVPGPGDTEAPVITLIGSPFVNVPLNGTYTEQGATWIDNVDGSGSAVVGGDVVDETTAGLYEVTYNYTDAGGNAATEVVRQVRVYVPGVGGLGRFRSILKPVVKGLIKAIAR